MMKSESDTKATPMRGRRTTAPTDIEEIEVKPRPVKIRREKKPPQVRWADQLRAINSEPEKWGKPLRVGFAKSLRSAQNICSKLRNGYTVFNKGVFDAFEQESSTHPGLYDIIVVRTKANIITKKES